MILDLFYENFLPTYALNIYKYCKNKIIVKYYII